MEPHSPADPASPPQVLPYCNVLPTPPGTSSACVTPLLQQPTNISPTDIATISAKLEDVKISKYSNALLQRDALPQPRHRPVDSFGDVPAGILEELLGPSTDPYMKERFFDHVLLEEVYELCEIPFSQMPNHPDISHADHTYLVYVVERGLHAEKGLRRLLIRIEDRCRAVVKGVCMEWQAQCDKEKVDLEKEKVDLEKEKVDLEKEKTELAHKWEREKDDLSHKWEREKDDLAHTWEKEKVDLEKEKTELAHKWEREKVDLEKEKTELAHKWEREKVDLEKAKTELAHKWEREKVDLEKEKTELAHKWEREKDDLSHTWEREKDDLAHTWEKEKVDLENQLNQQHINAKHDKDLYQAEKENLKQRSQYAEKRTIDLEESITRWRSTSNQDKFNPRGGSVSRAMSWEKDPVIIQVRPTLKKSNELSSDEKEQLEKSFENILSRPNATEIECYGPIQDAVNTFVPNINCYDTSKSKYLGGESPDISICLVRSIRAHTHLCYGIIEAKRPAELLETAAHLGQVKDYILTLMHAQTSRTRFWGFLTNMKENILIEIQRGKQISGNLQHTIIKYTHMEWAAVMNYLRDVTSTEDLCPPPLHFAKELGDIQDIISGSEKWTLGEFYIPDNVTKKMVVKYSKLSPPMAYHKQELKILRHLAACSKVNNAPCSIVKLVWDPAISAGDDYYESLDENSDPPLPRIQFGIAPVGRKFELAAFKTPAHFQDAIDTLLDGLNWLHNTARVIHRDIRPANVIIDHITKQPVIIDFDCAFLLQSDTQGGTQKVKLTTYGGGLICLPSEVLKLALKEYENGRNPMIQNIWYEPKAAHDLGAFVLLVLAILFPVQFKEFPAHKLQDSGSKAEIEELLNLHKELALSSIWGRIWTEALQGNVKELKRIGDLGWWPKKVTADTQRKPGGSISFNI
ncbi:hypothetical protein EV426DRAFT_706358 [Tirmania nivea]|nr:hypothetical protein EV426DRAFT_706358 [Tirmania nivea]